MFEAERPLNPAIAIYIKNIPLLLVGLQDHSVFIDVETCTLNELTLLKNAIEKFQQEHPEELKGGQITFEGKVTFVEDHGMRLRTLLRNINAEINSARFIPRSSN